MALTTVAYVQYYIEKIVLSCIPHGCETLNPVLVRPNAQLLVNPPSYSDSRTPLSRCQSL